MFFKKLSFTIYFKLYFMFYNEFNCVEILAFKNDFQSEVIFLGNYRKVNSIYFVKINICESKKNLRKSSLYKSVKYLI